MRTSISVRRAAPRSLRVPRLHAVLRHVPARLRAHGPGARLHAAARPAADRRLSARVVAGALHRREHRAARATPTSPGPTSSWSAACTSRRRRSRTSASRAHAAGKVTVLGGPSVSSAPEMYPDFDYLHVGEIGDATDELIGLLDASVARPPAQVRLTTKSALALDLFPLPAYDMIPLYALPHRQPAVLQRLSVSLRVLRHPGPLRPPAAAQDGRAAHRRARGHAAPARASDRDLFRR